MSHELTFILAFNFVFCYSSICTRNSHVVNNCMYVRYEYIHVNVCTIHYSCLKMQLNTCCVFIVSIYRYNSNIKRNFQPLLIFCLKHVQRTYKQKNINTNNFYIKIFFNICVKSSKILKHLILYYLIFLHGHLSIIIKNVYKN